MDQNAIDLIKRTDQEPGAHYCPMKIGHRELADSFLSKGKLVLAKGAVQEALKCFDEALKLDPKNAALYYSQGSALFEYAKAQDKARFLLHASKKFKMATLLDPAYFEAYQAWASTLCALGVSYGQHHYFQEAERQALRARSLSTGQSAPVLANLHWELGAIYMHVAHYSKEAFDVHRAINAFFEANSLHPQTNAEFWKVYGSACHAFAMQINDAGFYARALFCLKNAIAFAPGIPEYWLLYATVLHALYFCTHDEDYFAQANECYAKAAELQPNAAQVAAQVAAKMWQQWAEFLCSSARKMYDLDRLRSCVEKCQRAFSCDPENLEIQALLAEALAMLGSEAERLDILYEAQNRISSVIERAEHVPIVWYAYGITLKALGRYFDDPDYYYQAIEKFQAGLSIDRTCHMHWHAIGHLYALLGELAHEPEDLERSCRFYQRAIDLNPCTFYIIDYAIALYKLGDMLEDQLFLEKAIAQFERAQRALQKNAFYTHPDWLFYYACTLDSLGDYHEEEHYYARAIELLSHVLLIDPDFHTAHHHLALTLSHLGELTDEIEHFYLGIHHLRLVIKQLEENDCLFIDFATILMNIAYRSCDSLVTDQCYLEAEHKLWRAIELGNAHGYYHLACLYSLTDRPEKAMDCLYRAGHFDILPSIDELLQDEWLDNLRATGNFIAFLTRLEQHGTPREE